MRDSCGGGSDLDSCLFCRIVRGEIPARIVFQDDDVLAFEDISPEAPTHILIIPKAHIATLNDVTPVNSDVISRIYEIAARLAQSAGIADTGYRVVANCNAAAGQTVFHMHFHLLGGRVLAWPPG